ncbi:MAG TPA: ATPase domain-containing protein, partial [Candidatus Aminicenantes bacterium]|nr:ATPase domain-containing protein [Candidatus Aminicenantes bacterium]
MKTSPQFECVECGYQSPKLYGRCPQCQNWNSMTEIVPDNLPGLPRAGKPAVAVPLSQIEGGEQPRILTGITEFDRVLGGGLVPASVVLIGGEPGVGKSTLLLEVAGRLADPDRRVLYYSGEESAVQIKLRADRIGVASDQVLLVTQG